MSERESEWRIMKKHKKYRKKIKEKHELEQRNDERWKKMNKRFAIVQMEYQNDDHRSPLLSYRNAISIIVSVLYNFAQFDPIHRSVYSQFSEFSESRK